MRVAKISRKALLDAATNRPEGYVATVVGKAIAVTDAHVTLLEADYIALKRMYRPPPGPGTELKKLLKSLGIEAKPNCSCNKRALLMDENESKAPGWCEANIETISGWLAEESKKRGLPYIASAGKLLIRMAIRRAKRGNGSV